VKDFLLRNLSDHVDFQLVDFVVDLVVHLVIPPDDDGCLRCAVLLMWETARLW
jgi:hypothetical protein